MMSVRTRCRLAAASAWTRVPATTRSLTSVSSTSVSSPGSPSIAKLPARRVPHYHQATSSLLSLQWSKPLRNVLLVVDLWSPEVLQAAAQFADFISTEYSWVNVVVESRAASVIRNPAGSPLYVADHLSPIAGKIDAVVTFGGDGTVLRAASLFKLHGSVPPILSFRMGSLNFLGEWDFADYKRAWREMYMSGSDAVNREDEWERLKGRSQGTSRASKILLRQRLQADVWDKDGRNITDEVSNTLVRQASSGIGGSLEAPASLRAVNEISAHRHSYAHPAIFDVYHNGEHLTEMTADGILVSTPTGSTAYNVSAGGPIVHPLVRSLLITPLNSRGFGKTVMSLPMATDLRLHMSSKNRGRHLDLCIDGRHCATIEPGSEIRLRGEAVGREGSDDKVQGGVPCVVDSKGVDPWVGGLNRLSKLNRPFTRGNE